MIHLISAARTANKHTSFGRNVIRLIVLAFVLGAASQPTGAQQLPTADQLQQLQQQLQQNGQNTTPGVAPQQVILEPSTPNQKLPPSRLEQILSGRAGARLRQFGYDQLGVGRAVTIPQMGAVQDSYVLGPGDEIVVTLRGQENSEYRTTVDRDGMVTLPRLTPISAAGRTLGDFRQTLVVAIQRAYVSTSGYVTIGQVRQVNVLVSGEVNSPGVRIVSGLSTPVDAILVSGGVKKSGSLRNVYILRQGRRITIDLYSVLTGGALDRPVALADGDRIVVPPLGPTAAAVGWVRRPGIYEIGGGRSTIGVRELQSLAGGLEVRGKYRLSVLKVAPDGRNQMVSLASDAGTIGDSDILFVQPAASQTSSMATLSGGTSLAGQYAVTGTKLSAILKSPGALGGDPYTLFGIISRRDSTTLLRVLVPFTPVAVLKGSQDMNVQSDDIVRVISTQEARVLFAAIREYRTQSQADLDSLRNPHIEKRGDLGNLAGNESANAAAIQSAAQSANSTQAASLAALASATNRTANAIGTGNGDFYQPQAAPLDTQQAAQPYTQNLQEGPDIPGEVPTNVEVKRVADLAGQLRVDPLVLINFLGDHSINVDGAVQGAGLYLVGPDADIQSVVAAAGGLARWADRSAIEVISTSVDPNAGSARTERRTLSLAGGADAGFIVSPQDEIRVNEVFTQVGIGSVVVQGQVRNVGTYQIVRGEHLSDLLSRAGGLTESAYPYGTVFLRRSAAEREQDAFRRQAQEIQDQLLVAMSRRDSNSKLSPDAFVAMQGYINQIKNQKALGRVAVSADPAVLAANPDADPVLEPGDVIFVPQRPFSVAVLGEVLQPRNVPFRSDMSASDYIDSAGGYSQFADESETILVLPDGSARRLSGSWFSLGRSDIPPGSTIYVARDISGIDLHQVIVDTTAIVSQLAVTAASLAVLSRQ
jgi:polysaccharide biosynthesis/export protein